MQHGIPTPLMLCYHPSEGECYYLDYTSDSKVKVIIGELVRILPMSEILVPLQILESKIMAYSFQPMYAFNRHSGMLYKVEAKRNSKTAYTLTATSSTGSSNTEINNTDLNFLRADLIRYKISCEDYLAQFKRYQNPKSPINVR